MNLKSLTVASFLLLVFSVGTGTADGSELSAEMLLQGILPSGELDGRFDNTFGGAFSLTYMYTPYVGVNTSINHHTFSRDRDGSDFAVWHLNLDGELAYPFLDAFRAYIIGGMGVYIWNIDRAWWTDYQSKDGANLGFNMGAGLNYRLSNDLGAVLQFRRHGVELTDRDSRVYWNDVSLGVRFMLDSSVLEH